MRHLGEAVNMSQSMIHRSQLDDVIVPLETVHSIVATAAERRPDGVAGIDAESGCSITSRVSTRRRAGPRRASPHAVSLQATSSRSSPRTPLNGLSLHLV